ncbi:hypothetical protein EMCRGX_G013599 [Ephydatia muelleri]
MDDNVVDSIQYQQWTQTDRSSLKTVVQPVEEFLDEFMAVLKKLQYHDFIAKTAADGVAGTLKRLATKASLQHPDGNHILNAKQLFDFAVREIKGISFCYVTSNEHREEADLLRDRFDRSITIPGTQKFHNFKPIDKSTIEVKNYSTSSKAYKKRVSKL